MNNNLKSITEFIYVETVINEADVVIIPGASHPELMVVAAELYHKGLAKYILPTGGPNANLKQTEASFLTEVGLSLNVPDEVILKENKALNTFENALYALELIKNNNIPFNRVVLVTKTSHSRRVLLTFELVFPKTTCFFVKPVIDRTGITKDNWHLTERGREVTFGELKKIGTYLPLIQHTLKK